MTNRILVIAIISILTLIAVFFAFKYFKAKKEADEARNLLSQAVLSVDRDNKHIYNELGEIIAGTYYDKRIPEMAGRRIKLDSFYKASLPIDSLSLLTNLFSIAKHKLTLNDSLKNFSKGWNICGFTTDKMEILEFYEHAPFYKYGDTVKFVFSIRNPPYFLENNFELIGFSKKEFGSRKNNTVIYSIPTVHFMSKNEAHKVIDFDYQLMLRNSYSNKIDTMFLTTKFTVDR